MKIPRGQKFFLNWLKGLKYRGWIDMILKDIEILRERLNKMIEIYDCSSEAVLELSRKLDILILSYLKDSSDKKCINADK